MKAVIFEGYGIALGRGQDYLPLPAHCSEGVVTTCWQVDAAELAEIIRTRRVWVQIFNPDAAPLQPLKVLATKPEL